MTSIGIVPSGTNNPAGRCSHWDRYGVCMHDIKHADNRPKPIAHICSVFGCGAAMDGSEKGEQRHYLMIHSDLPRLLQVGPAIVTLRVIR